MKTSIGKIRLSEGAKNALSFIMIINILLIIPIEILTFNVIFIGIVIIKTILFMIIIEKTDLYE